MTARPLTLVSPGLVAVGGALAAAMAGALLVHDVPLGLALLAACCYLPILLLNLPLAVVLWIPIVSLEYSMLLGPAPFLASLAVVLCWLGVERSRTAVRELVDRRPVVVAGVVLLLIWMLLSVGWASDTGVAWEQVRLWALTIVTFLVVATALRTPRHLRLAAVAYVAGALLSFALGSLLGLTTSPDEFDGNLRLAGGAGDPNYTAAQLVPAAALAIGLLPGVRDPLARLGLVGALVALLAGLIATQSRGGLIAAAVAAVVAVLLAGPFRGRALAAVGLSILVCGLVFSASPAAVERITDFEAGGTGREELWLVGWRVVADHPLVGVGLGGFQEAAPGYVREPGALEWVNLIAEDPHVAHNIVLQSAAELGIPATALLLLVMGICVHAGLVAARRFEAGGRRALGILARAGVVASIGTLTASMFISNGSDKRIWILLGFNLACLAVARAHEHRGLAASTPLPREA